jgi:choice-of-anchor A domain-containing protein
MGSSTLVADSSNPNTNPWLLNVYAIQNIGSQANPYSNSDFQGMAGSGQNTYLQNFSVNNNGISSSSAPYAIYVGGVFNLNGGTLYNGGAESGGKMTLNQSTTQGSVSSGGNLSGSGGTITGNATLAGQNQSTITIGGTVRQNQSYTPFLNQTSIANFFKNSSNYWQSLSPTTTYSISFGTLTLSNPISGLNIVNIPLASWEQLTGIQNNLPSNAYVVFNIADSTTPSFDTLNAISLNGLNPNQVLINLANATILALQGGTYASVLAPNATITFNSGVLQGNLVANNLFGSGQVNSGAFIGFENLVTPEPTTYLLLGSMLGLIVFLSWRKNQSAMNLSQ